MNHNLSTMSNIKYFKILNKDRNHNGFQYKIGLNVLPQGEFARTGLCVPGGFYYTTIKHILKFVDYGVDLFEVIIPADAQIRKNCNKFRADKIILGNHYSLFNISTYKMLKEMEPNINISDSECINFSAKHGLIPLFNFFVESIPNPNYSEVFYKAAEHGQLSFIKIIVDKITDYFNYSMFFCSKRGHLNIIEFLIEKNPNYVYDRRNNCSFFVIVIEYNHLNIVKYLIKKYPEGYSFDSILTAASEYNRPDIFRYIATELSIKSNYPLILLLASKMGYLDIIQQFSGLVDSGIFIECASTAASFGHLSILKYFVDSNTNIIDIVNYRNYYVLDSYKYNNVIKYLIENTVDKVNHLETYTRCIIESASSRNIEIFELVFNILIKDGADIGQIFGGNSYKLMNCISILKLAISHGFQPKIEDLSKAAIKAAYKRDLLLVEYLIKLGAILNLSAYDFKNICADDNLPIIKLLTKNCTILFKNEHSYEFIYVAALNNHVNIVNYLINEFVLLSDIYTKLLRKCIVFSNLDIIKLFVDSGANIDIKTITKAIKHGHLDAIEYFVECGIVITQDLIIYAADKGYDNIAGYLKKLIL